MKRLLHQVKTYVFPPKAAAEPAPVLAAADWQLAIDRLQQWSVKYGHAPCLPGRCNVCGEATAFFCKDQALARESYTCGGCGTTSRYRAIASGVLRWFAEQLDVHAESLAGLREQKLPRKVRVYDAQLPFYYNTCSYPLPDLLAAVDGVQVMCSRFRGADPLGAPIEGREQVVNPAASNQNLERLTFADASFDLVITSDVMEHVRLDALAHAEIRRVLAPGGAYLFTVPHSRTMAATMHRVVVHDPLDPGQDEFVMEREYHGDTNDPENAALSFRVYGTDLDETLRSLGLSVDYTFFPLGGAGVTSGVLNTELFYCKLPG